MIIVFATHTWYKSTGYVDTIDALDKTTILKDKNTYSIASVVECTELKQNAKNMM